MAGTCNLDSAVDTTANSFIKVRKMIADNYTILFTYLILVGIIAFIIYYFGKQIIVLMRQYFANRTTDDKSTIPASSNSSDTKEADNNNYDPDMEIPLENTYDYMDPAKQNFVKSIDKVYQDYNQKMDDFVRSIGKTDNDNKVDAGILFKAHDDYRYVENGNP